MSTEEVTASLNYVSTASAEAAREWDLLNPDFRGFMPLIETACDVHMGRCEEHSDVEGEKAEQQVQDQTFECSKHHCS
jgi:hypothetical protein